MFKWLVRKIYLSSRKKRFDYIIRKYAKTPDIHDAANVRQAYREAYIYEGDIRDLIDWLELRAPGDYRYESAQVQSMFRCLLVEVLFSRQGVRTDLFNGMRGIDKMLDERKRKVYKNLQNPGGVKGRT